MSSAVSADVEHDSNEKTSASKSPKRSPTRSPTRNPPAQKQEQQSDSAEQRLLPAGTAVAPKFVRSADSQKVIGEESPPQKKIKSEPSGELAIFQGQTMNHRDGIDSLELSKDFIEGDFDTLKDLFNTPNEVLNRADLSISAIDRYNFKRNGREIMKKYPQIHLELNDALFKVREMHRYDLTKNEHRYSIKEDLRILETQFAIPAASTHPSSLWFEHLLQVELNFDEESCLALEDDEYLSLLRSRLEEVEIIEKFSPEQKNKRKSRPLSDTSSPSKKKKDSKAKAPSKSNDVSKVKPKKEKPAFKEIPATMGTVFDDVPNKLDLRLRRTQERAFHQSKCTFRELSDMILGIKETQVAEEVIKKTIIEDNSVPVHFNGVTCYIPKERHSFVGPLIFDGFESITSDFICPSYEKRISHMLGQHKKRRASTLQEILKEGKLHSIRDPAELKKEIKKIWQTIVRKEAPKYAMYFFPVP
jgi:hypothetical protein